MRHFAIVTVLVVGGLARAAAFAQVGACCSGDGSCSDTNLAGCDLGPGEFLGEGTTCATTVCLGACCLDEKACAEDTLDGCDAAVGTFQGAGTTCALHCAAKLPTAFTYQGQLKQAGVPLGGSADLEFSLWTSAKGGDQVGSTLFKENVLVAGGLLSVLLDFGINVFNGNARWLEIAVRSPHDPGDTELFTSLSPRQLITATPYALQTRGMVIGDDGNVLFNSMRAIEGTVTYSSIGGIDMILDADTNNVGENQNARIVMKQDGGLVVARMGYREATNTLEIMQEYSSNLVLGTNNRDRLTVRSNGNIGIGTSSPDRSLDIAGSNPVLRMTHAGSTGPHIEMRNTMGGILTRTLGSIDFIDLNNDRRGGISYVESLFGSGLVFDAVSTGTAAVAMPDGAISAPEILDEPGVAGDSVEPNCCNIFGCSTCCSLPTGSNQVVSTQTLTAPTSGYIVAIGTIEVIFTHSNGTNTLATFGLSTSTSFTPSGDSGVRLPTALPSGSYMQTVTVNNVFAAGSGNTTVNFLVLRGSGGLTRCDVKLTLMFFPTAYGSTTSSTVANFEGNADELSFEGLSTLDDQAASFELPDDELLTLADARQLDVEADSVESVVIDSPADPMSIATTERELSELRAMLISMQGRMEALQEQLDRVEKGEE